MSAEKGKHEETKIKNNREGRFRYALPYLHLHYMILISILWWTKKTIDRAPVVEKWKERNTFNSTLVAPIFHKFGRVIYFHRCIL